MLLLIQQNRNKGQQPANVFNYQDVSYLVYFIQNNAKNNAILLLGTKNMKGLLWVYLWYGLYNQEIGKHLEDNSRAQKNF